nr:hypothetical protein [Pseudomonas sp.]
GTSPGKLDTGKSDLLVVKGYAGFEVAYVATGSLHDAVSLLAEEGKAAVFHLDHDTYAFADDGSCSLDSHDQLVKLIGELDLQLLVWSLNHGTSLIHP